jgi:hypothetical protein
MILKAVIKEQKYSAYLQNEKSRLSRNTFKDEGYGVYVGKKNLDLAPFIP